MAKRRDQIKMTPEEVATFLDGRHTLNVASFNHDGTIHLVAMWYAMDGDKPVFWTYAKSQKIRNLERDPRVTCLVEDGETYDVLRGVEIVGTAEIVTDRDELMEIGRKVVDRYQGPYTPEFEPFLERIGAKRWGVRVTPQRIVSWDHSKVEGY